MNIEKTDQEFAQRFGINAVVVFRVVAVAQPEPMDAGIDEVIEEFFFPSDMTRRDHAEYAEGDLILVQQTYFPPEPLFAGFAAVGLGYLISK